MKPLVSIVITNWNGKDHIEECLTSLLKQSYKNYEVIFVDNGSTDGSVEFIKKKFPKIKLIQNKKNNGFAKANNQGFLISKGNYIIFLNNDTKADKNWLNELVIAAEKYPEIGMFSSKMLFYNNPKIINSRGLKLFYDAKAVDDGFNVLDSKEKVKDVFGPCGGASFFRKKLIEDISFNNEFYDEDFFIYSEDLDVAFRSRLKGWKCLYIPTAIIYHKHNATAKKEPDLALYHYTKNKIFIIIKNYPLALLIKYSLVILLRQLISLIYYILKLRFSAVKSRIVVIYYLPKMLRKRWKIQRTKRVSNKELKKWLLPRPLLSSLFSN